jgi:F-type H+-transporting ATPase subunit b
MEILNDIASKIGFDWKLSLTHLINFSIIFFLLVRFALPGIKKTINERTKKIEEGLKMRLDADKIVESANTDYKKIVTDANQKAQDIITKGESSAKIVITSANEKAGETLRLAQQERDQAKEKGIKDAENIVTKDLSKILSKISAQAFSSKLTGDVNSDFVGKVFSGK